MTERQRAFELDEMTGEAYIRFGGKEYTIQPPLLGQMRELDILAEKLTVDARSEAEKRVADAIEAEGDDAEISDEDREQLLGRRISDVVPELLPWWRKLFDLCGDAALPEDDACPIWMGTNMLVTRISVHWQMHPFLGLGLPVPE